MNVRYDEYIASEEWRKKREERLKFANHRCELCYKEDSPDSPLQVHHRTYERLGNEDLSDLIVLCGRCHYVFHHRIGLHSTSPNRPEQEKPTELLKPPLVDNLALFEAVHGRAGGITGLPSGFHRLDELTGGWQRGDLIIIAARPSMGSTSFVLACARNAALHPEYPVGVGFFSVEMSDEQLVQRLLTAEASVNAQAARTGRLSNDDWPRLARSAKRLSAAPLVLYTTPRLPIPELRSEARAMHRAHDVGLVIIDGLRGLEVPWLHQANREQQVAGTVRELKALAMEMNVPVILTAPLSRAVETRGGDKRPQLSDLRDSGALEDEADVVAFIYRAERYGITVDENGNSTEGLGEIIISKQRNGPIGNVQLAFVRQFARFENLTTYYAAPGSGGYDAGAEGYGAAQPPLTPDDTTPF